jgi:adenylate cyclase
MAAQNFKRKLAAILHADVKGYSRLMGEDEEATVSTLTACMEIMTVLVLKHRGRVVGGAGDSLLAEFASVVDAVRCAVEIQDGLKTENAELSEDRKVVFRIGINLGDVIEKDGDLLGDGVNIAARVEALADGGGICITRSAYDQVKNKLNLVYEYQGEHQVKNIAEPVRVYKVLTAPGQAGKLIGETKIPTLPSKKSSIAIFAILALVVAAAIYYFYPRSPEIEPASIEKMAFPLPDKPSIAVLPFDNMSGDPNQEYFSDGITEHIITSLSKVPYIFVIARNSTFAYKDQAITINQIAEELGVRYVLEGSVQRSKDQVRITVQLIDATTGYHLWAENYDRQLKDIFALQDDIAMKIMAEMQVKISVKDMGRLSLIKTTNIKAYEKFLKAYEHLRRRTEGDILQVRKLSQEAIELDPEFGDAYLMMGWTHLDDIWFYRTKSRKKSLELAEQFGQKAIILSADEASTHRLFASIYMLRKEYEMAIAEGKKSVDLAPNSAVANFILGMVLRNAGSYGKAIPFLKKAIRLDPITPVNFLNNLAWAYTYLSQYEKAVPLWNKAIKKNADYLFAYTGLAAAYQLLGNEEKAKQSATEVLRIKPKISIELIEKRIVVKNEEDKKRILEALRKAGIPD